MQHRILGFVLVAALFATFSLSQQPSPGSLTQPTDAMSGDAQSSPPGESKRILGITPNYRISPSLLNYEPVTAGEKFKLASEDAFDRGTVALAALFAGHRQLTNANPAFGQGAPGFGRYWATAYGDFLIGDYMTEGVFPTLLHQDPRYFRRGLGSGASRPAYAMGQIFWMHRDSGGTQFNHSEVVGDSVGVAISNAYYVDNRTASDAVSKLGWQLGVDVVSNIIREFWPDMEGKFRRKALKE